MRVPSVEQDAMMSGSCGEKRAWYTQELCAWRVVRDRGRSGDHCPLNHVYGEGEEGMVRLGSKEKRGRCRRTSLIVPSHDDETNKSFLMLFQSTE